MSDLVSDVPVFPTISSEAKKPQDMRIVFEGKTGPVRIVGVMPAQEIPPDHEVEINLDGRTPTRARLARATPRYALYRETEALLAK